MLFVNLFTDQVDPNRWGIQTGLADGVLQACYVCWLLLTCSVSTVGFYLKDLGFIHTYLVALFKLVLGQF